MKTIIKKKASVVISIPDKLNLNIKSTIRIKGKLDPNKSIRYNYYTFLIIYQHSLKYIKQKLRELQGEIIKSITKSTIMMGDVNTPFSVTDTSKQNTTNATKDLNYRINKHDLMKIHRTLHSVATEKKRQHWAIHNADLKY